MTCKIFNGDAFLVLNQSSRDWRIPKELRFQQTAFRVPPLGGSGSFTSHVVRLKPPLPPKDGTLNAA